MKTLTTLFVLCTTWTLVRGAAANDAPDPRITLNTAGESLQVVLDTLAEQSGYNIVAPENATLKVRVSLRDVTLKEALDGILLLNGFQYVIQRTTILVYDAANAEKLKALGSAAMLEARYFELKHVTVRNVKDVIEGLLSPRGKLMVVSRPRVQSWQREDGFLASVPSSANAARGGTAKDDDDERAYRLLVVDEPSALSVIESVIAKVDVAPRQVYISAVIFELGLNEEEQIGLRWRLSGSVSPSSLPWNFPFGHGNLGEFSPHVSASEDLYPGPRSSAMFPDNAASDFLFGRIDMSASSLLAELNRLGTDLNLISNPRLMVADRQEATILVGEKYPILRSTITDQGTVTETFDRYEPIGVQLRVIPSILSDHQVSFMIEPQITGLGQTVTGTTGLSYPRITTRRVESTIRVADGESVVIGGLVSERESVTTQRVPLLADIPLLGYLFRHTSTTRDKIDLVVVITPYVDRAPNLDALDRELERAGFKASAKRLMHAATDAAAAPREASAKTGQ